MNINDFVNKVGVDVNTATPSLLSYVSGVNSSISENNFEKIDLAQDALNNFIDNYCSKEDIETFMQSLANADKKTIEMIQQLNDSKQNSNDISGQKRR